MCTFMPSASSLLTSHWPKQIGQAQQSGSGTFFCPQWVDTKKLHGKKLEHWEQRCIPVDSGVSETGSALLVTAMSCTRLPQTSLPPSQRLLIFTKLYPGSWTFSEAHLVLARTLLSQFNQNSHLSYLITFSICLGSSSFPLLSPSDV